MINWYIGKQLHPNKHQELYTIWRTTGAMEALVDDLDYTLINIDKLISYVKMDGVTVFHRNRYVSPMQSQVYSILTGEDGVIFSVAPDGIGFRRMKRGETFDLFFDFDLSNFQCIVELNAWKLISK